MSERIHKLQPDRTIQLRGFDHLGAAAAMHSATPGGFTVSGVFRDAADFAVLTLWDADNFYEHPRLKYLPDFHFAGLTLRFDVRYENLMPLDCRKYPTIDWPFLDVITRSGETRQVRLSDYAQVVDTPNPRAAAEFTIQGDDLEGYDRLTIWYLNLAYDYIVPGKVSTVWSYTAGTPGHLHSVTIGGRAYEYIEQAGDTSPDIAGRLAARINGLEGGYAADPDVAATANAAPGELRLATKLDTGATVPVSGSGHDAETLHHVKTATVCRALRDQINAVDYALAQTPYALRAEADGATLRIETVEGGFDANFITLYATWKNGRLRTAERSRPLAGGASTAVLRVTLDFAALGLDEIRTMWLTFAPRLAAGKAFESEEWAAVFTNWAVSGPEQVKYLRFAGPASTVVGCAAPQCEYTGGWEPVAGFYPDNAARRSTAPGASVTVRLSCEQPHEIWLTTEFAPGRPDVVWTFEGESGGALTTALEGTAPFTAKRRLAALRPAGETLITLSVPEGQGFMFSALEAVVPADTPGADQADARVSAALDYSTDHTFKLPPARILWMFDRLGWRAPLNEYLGVFWWNTRRREGGEAGSLTLEFAGEFVAGDQVLLDIGGQLCGKTVFVGDSLETIAAHFAWLINATYVGVWAHAEGAALRIEARSAAPAYQFPVSAAIEAATGSTGALSGMGVLPGGSMGAWVIDADAPEPLNRAARDWHRDFYTCCAAHQLGVTTACSMELVNPPPAFAAHFPGGAPVITSVGFGNLSSTHCSFNESMLAFHKRVYLALAGLMNEAGLTPSLQCGEFCWWYFTNWSADHPGGGMAYYDPETQAAAHAALGRPLHVFRQPFDDPGVNGGADAQFLRHRLRDYVESLTAHVRTTYPAAKFEVLFPYDVNYPVPAGVHLIGGSLNRFVNLPPEWEAPGSSGFDRFKIEALDFGAWSRDLDLVRDCLRFGRSLGWPTSSLGLMTPVFRGGYPWEREMREALQMGYGQVHLWAFDHLCLYGGTAKDRQGRRAIFQG